MKSRAVPSLFHLIVIVIVFAIVVTPTASGQGSPNPQGWMNSPFRVSPLRWADGVPAPLPPPAVVIDSFDESLDAWSAHPSDGVELRISQDYGEHGKALRLDFDFHGRAGYAIARRKVDLDFSSDYEFTWRMRANAPRNNLEFKLLDQSGDNVWWMNRLDYLYPSDWTTVATHKRQIRFAWGPSGGGEISHAAGLEIVITAGTGGKGTVWIDDLEMQELSPDFVLKFGRAFGGRPGQWEWPGLVEMSALVVDWTPGEHFANFSIEVSRDGQTFETVKEIHNGRGGRQIIWLPNVDAHMLKIVPAEPEHYADNFFHGSFEMKPGGWADTPSELFARLAVLSSRRGDYPRYLVNDQPYWTIVGADRAEEEVLVGEDGNIEPFKSGFSIEPFLRVDGNLLSWAAVQTSHSLDRGDLPIPTITWRPVPDAGMPGVQLDTTVFVSDEDVMYARYRVQSESSRRVSLYLAIRPFQVNPTTQFLNTPGGFSPIRDIEFDGVTFLVNDAARIVPQTRPDRAGGAAFDDGNIVDFFWRGETGARVCGPKETLRVVDSDGFASGALEYKLELKSGKAREIVIAVPLRPNARITTWEGALQKTRRAWREELDRVKIEIPAAPEVANTLRSNVAYVLINRDGAGLQPGSRSYERSWIRDGALIASCLLRLGDVEVAREFAEWFAPYQFDSGKVPCCVDHRGADPVPENDSHGEFIYLVAEIWRFTHDEAFVRRMWPRVDAATRYIAKLRSENHGEFDGLLTESISHEGYSAKPMHSYWDDFFGVRGVDDAVMLAGVLKMADRQRELQQQAESFRSDMAASIRRTMASHHIDFVPGSAELGDFDATSTAIAVSPLELTALTPAGALDRTFARYLDEFRARRDGKIKWDVYTPYEMRSIGALVRRGNRAAANELLDYFMNDRRPQAWNEWAEVVPRDPRAPHFLGDMPHSWVGSDFIRSILDFFAYDREDGALVVGAGIPEKWVRGSSVHAGPLRTYTGTIDVKMRGDQKQVVVELGGTARPPGGIVVRSPYEGAPRRVTAGGKVLTAADSANVGSLPARVVFEY